MLSDAAKIPPMACIGRAPRDCPTRRLVMLREAKDLL